MVATMTLDQLLDAARSVGLSLTEVDGDDAPLYAWVTPERELVYIGKAASPRRFREEAAWLREDPTSDLLSGFIALVRRNRASARALTLDSYDPTVARLAAQHWSGDAFDRLAEWLDDPRPISVEAAETLLIRIVVRCGVPIGNSRDASQWESPIGTPVDTLAALAALSYLDAADITATPS